MNQNDLQLRVGIKADEVSKGLKDLANDIKKFGGDVGKTSTQTTSLGTSVVSMAKGFALGQLAVQGINAGFRALTSQIKESVKASMQMESAMIGLQSVSAAFGQDQRKATDAAKSLSKDGLMSVSESANGLKNLLATGFSLPEAINLMNAFKDSAAFNRQGTLDFGQAIVGATIGLKNQNSILVDNAGVTKNLSIILKEAGFSQNDLMMVTSDATVRQAVYNGILRETAAFQGDAARLADTLQGSLAALSTTTFMVQAQFGQALAPALRLIIQDFNGLLGSTLTNTEGQKRLAIAMVTISEVVRKTALIIETYIRVAIANWTRDIDRTRLVIGALVKVFQSVFGPVIQWASGVIEAAKQKLSEFANTIKGKVKPALDFINKALGRPIEQMQDFAETLASKVPQPIKDFFAEFQSIGTNFESEIQMIKSNFTEAWDEIGKSSQETIDRISTEGLGSFQQIVKDTVAAVNATSEEAKKIAEDIAKEMKKFAKTVTQMKKDFTENLRDLVIAHREKVDEIKDQISEEKEAMQEAVDAIKDKYSEEIKQMRIAAQDRITSLQRQLDKEKAKEDKANSDKITALEEMIRREKIALDDQIKNKEDLIQEEIDEEKEKHQKRLDELQTSLDQEIEIQKKHDAEFAQYKDAVKEDDIARLKRKFQEEMVLLQQEHEERLAEIKKQAKAESDARVSFTSSGSPSSTGSSGVTGGKEPSFEEAFNAIYKGWPREGAYQDFLATGGKNKAGYEELKRKVNGFAQGGIVNRPTVGMIGEDGSEAIIPLTKPRRAQQVLEQAGITRNVTINAPMTIIQSEPDIDRLVERLAFEMKGAGLI